MKTKHKTSTAPERAAKSGKWYNELPKEPKKFPSLTEQKVQELKAEAKICHDSETADFNIKNSKGNSQFQWMKTLMTKGTLQDRIASFTVAIQDDPIHNLDTLQNFVGLVKVSKKKECVNAMVALTDLFIEDLLIPDRKLHTFHQKPLAILNELSSGNAITRRRILSAWYFEDQLKETFNSFIDSLNMAAHEAVEANKEKAVASMFKLLSENPEQEKKLLSSIVNKLGDPSQKVASKAIYCLESLLQSHSNMQGVVLNEVESLLFRSNISTKAQYYGLCFLSQFYLSHEEADIAKRLIDIYFGFFKACVKKGDIDSRMMSALLMGVNRAYPYAKLDVSKISEHLDTIYRIIHMANFNVSLHALNLVYQVSDCANNLADRFYCALYKKLLDPQITTTTHQAMLLSLLYKALLKDAEINRVKALVKRLLQLTLYLPPNFICGILYLISQLIGKRNQVHSITQKQVIHSGFDNDDENDEEVYKDVKEEILPIEDDPVTNENSTSEDAKSEITNGQPGWFHRNISIKTEKKSNSNSYNPDIRNPLYAGAEHTAFLELNFLCQHFHPTVALYAENILNGEIIKYQGDPLKDFTLIRFLDRFVFKNPKKVDDIKGSHPLFGQRKSYQPRGIKSLSVNSRNYLNSGERDIPADEKFLYAYLNKVAETRSKDDKQDDSDVESVVDDEFDEMLEKMVGTKDFDADLDFMNDIGDNLKKKGEQKEKDGGDDSATDYNSDEENDDINEDDIESELDEEEENFMEDGDDELIDDLEDDDDEDIVFDDVEKQKSHKKSTKSKKQGIQSLFASADEFATLLEDEGNQEKKPGSSNVLSNKDRAGAKQLKWEENRNRWLSGYKNALGNKKQIGSFKGKKRTNSDRKGNLRKKQKK